MSTIRRTSRSRGFTLLELTIALALAALVTATVIVGLRATLRQARLERDLAQLAAIDERIRARSAESGRRWELTIDLERDELRWGETGRKSTASNEEAYSCRRLETVVLAGRRHESGATTIRYDADGRSAAFAVALSEDGTNPVWLTFSSLAGCVARTVGEPIE